MDTNNIKKTFKTVMWKDSETGKYIIQTDDPAVHHKLMRRNSAVLYGSGHNCNVWLYKVPFSRLIKAREGLARPTGGKVYFEASESFFTVKTVPILHVEKESVVDAA
ncbi:hypothetical protein ACFL43_04480 [Thermodesulfobacteriota bacterium]